MNADVWEAIPEALAADGRVVVATIATRDGSAPRSAGTKMLIHPDGRLTGTLGGGLGEAMAVREAGKVFADGVARMASVDMAGSAMDGADLICGGRVAIFLQRLEADQRGDFRELCGRMRAGMASYVASPLAGAGAGRPVVIRPEEGGEWAEFAREARPDGALVAEVGGGRFLFEPLYARTRLVLAGGGHVSLATSRMAAEVGFDVTVVDDREEFANPGRFPWLEPERALAVAGFRECLSPGVLGFSVGAGCFVAVLTRGHSFDREVLAQALRTGAGYVGMIGSRRKRDALYEVLLGEGFSRAELERVHCPIGLAIGAETPEEIAVSIVAELIAARAQKNQKS